MWLLQAALRCFIGFMPVERHPISASQLCELLAVDVSRFRGITHDPCNKGFEHDPSRWWILLEPEHDMSQTTGAFPQLTQGGKTIGGKKSGGKKKC